MTREEAIKALERIDNYVGIHYINGVEEAYINPHLKKAVKVALAALTPPTQEQMERVWPGCDNCTAGDGEFRVYCDKWGTDDYCGHCGRPLTPEAWEEMRKRWEALKDGKID